MEASQQGPSPADVMAASAAAVEAAAGATSAAEAAKTAVETIREQLAKFGTELPQAMLDGIGAASAQAWEARMRELGALVEEGQEGSDGGAGGDAAAALLAAAAAAVPAGEPSPDDTIYPTMAHRLFKRGVRRGDWLGGKA